MKKFWNTEKIVSFSAIFISLATLYISYVQHNASIKQQKLSVMPYLSLGNEGTGSPNYQLILENNGIGPAFIESVNIFYNGKTYEGDLIKFLYDNFGAEMDSIRNLSYGNIYPGLMIPAGKKIPHVAIENSWDDANKLLKLLDKVEIDFEIIYASIYEERWSLTGNSIMPKKLKR